MCSHKPYDLFDVLLSQVRLIMKSESYKYKLPKSGFVFNRSGVASAVLQTPLSLIHSFIHSSISSKSSKNDYTQTVRTTELQILRESSAPTSFHISGVRCH